MSDKKTTKVYLMVECEIEASYSNPEGAVLGTLAALLAHACDSETEATYSFKLWENAPNVVVHSPKVLPDEFLEIIDPKERLRRTIARAEKRVAAHPEYMRGILEHSGQPTLSKPREPVRHLTLAERLVAAVKREGEKPAAKRWQALVDRGAINEKGEVLLKSPWNEGESGE